VLVMVRDWTMLYVYPIIWGPPLCNCVLVDQRVQCAAFTQLAVVGCFSLLSLFSHTHMSAKQSQSTHSVA
jgi:hypothetical protein